MIIHAYSGIKDSIPMLVINFFSVYLSFYEKLIIMSNYINLGLIKDNILITYLYLRL